MDGTTYYGCELAITMPRDGSLDQLPIDFGAATFDKGASGREILVTFDSAETESDSDLESLFENRLLASQVWGPTERVDLSNGPALYATGNVPGGEAHFFGLKSGTKSVGVLGFGVSRDVAQQLAASVRPSDKEPEVCQDLDD